jgi:Concanavalin A-like lectin/glucanases superfamily
MTMVVGGLGVYCGGKALAEALRLARSYLAVGVSGLVLLFSAAAGATPTNLTTPDVSGNFLSGQTVTAVSSPSDWGNVVGALALSYQWADCAAYSTTVNANHPVGYWRLGESSTSAKAADASGNAADGVFGGTITLGQSGALVSDPDPAASLDGSSGYVQVPNAPALNPASACTLEAWIKTSVSPSATQTIAAKPFTVGDKESFSLNLDTSGKADATIVTTSGTYTAASTGIVNDGQWHLLDATFASSSLKLYGDKTAASTTTAGTLQYSSLPLQIGRWDSTKGQYYSGLLDEVALYPSALSSTQITTDYNVATDPINSASCSAIAGQTGSTYVLQSSDVGHKIAVAVTATDSTGSTTAYSKSHTVLAGAPSSQSSPVNTLPPDISGTAATGETLTAANGNWSGTDPITLTYQWQRCNTNGCTNISGAAAQSYTVQNADGGYALLVVVTATNTVGSANASSPQTATVPMTAGAPVNTAPPTASGSTIVGQTVTATAGGWSSSTQLTLTYQWQYTTSLTAPIIWNSISGATDSSYAIGSTYAGDWLRVQVTAQNSAGNTTASSAYVGPVAAAGAPVNTSLPTVNGTFAVGETLTATKGVWSNTPSSYCGRRTVRWGGEANR